MNTCGEQHCDEQAVAWVRFQAYDCSENYPRWHSHEMDMCSEHYEQIEAQNDHVYVAINEVIEYQAHGTHWKELETA